MRGRGHGKIILLGEHAVVYGYPALAGALDRGVDATAVPAARLSLALPAWGLEIAAGDDHPVAIALAAIADAIGTTAGLRLEATAAIPPAAGLGSSAAMAVAVARAIAGAIGQPLGADQLLEVAGAAERQFHHNPSGVDVALAARGGLGLFRRGQGLLPLEVPPLSMVVGLSGEPRSTATMVERVATATGSDRAHPGLAGLGQLAERGAAHLAHGDLAGLGDAMSSAHRGLADLGVSTARLDEMVAAAERAGALGAKLTGAGGGGAVIALAPGREGEVAGAWRALGCESFVARVGRFADPS